MTDSAKRISGAALYTACDPNQFDFETTADIAAADSADIGPLENVFGQDRAVEAVRFAVGMRHQGYNLFAHGEEGTGKYSLVRRFLERQAADEPMPGDWCYINNFVESHRPRALRLPPGRGRPLSTDMERLVDELRAAIPAIFEGDEYRQRRTVIEEQFKEVSEGAFENLQKRALAADVALIRTPVGLALAPVRDGEVLKPDEFKALPEEEQEARKAKMEDLQHQLEEILQQMPQWEKRQREQIKALDREVTQHTVGFLIDELKTAWKDLSDVLDYLEAVRADVVDNAEDFLPAEQQAPQVQAVDPGLRRARRESPTFRRYRVNVIVDNGPAGSETGAPVVDEDNPTQPNLIGRIEHISQFGTLTTDFNLIKPGALHRANGGYLIVDARKLLLQPMAWETLKRALRARRIRVETLAESMGWAGTVSLDPEPIPLEVKVVLLGEPMLYYLLSQHDPDFRELFKVAADFDTRMDRDSSNANHYARLIATLAAEEGLKPLDRGAVARMVEHGARLADDAEKLTAHMGSIVDLVREADYWARRARSRTVKAAHVQRAIDAKVYRSDRLRERIQEEIRRGTLVIETEGEAVGQVNGLAVLQLDDFSFGRPSRISCRVRIGQGRVVDIEREVALGGPLHSKGVLILSAYLGTRFARKRPLSLSASLVFEQSYGGVDGDSASSAELYALLSALSGMPIKQSLAVTGSVDQNGRVQAIGGVNEKIEGFFDVCKARRLSGDQGVLIPAANVKHLMLRADIVEAVESGHFHIYAIETVDQGIAVLTGEIAGDADEDGDYPFGSVNRAVVRGLAELARGAFEARHGADTMRRLPGPPPRPPE